MILKRSIADSGGVKRVTGPGGRRPTPRTAFRLPSADLFIGVRTLEMVNLFGPIGPGLGRVEDVLG
jgi:hypothetical protein